MLQGLIETAPIGEDLTVTIERGGQRQDIVVRPQAQPVADRVWTCRSPARAAAGDRPDALRGPGSRPRAASCPASAPPLAGPIAGRRRPVRRSIPSRGPSRRRPAPSLEAPKNQPAGSPR